MGQKDHKVDFGKIGGMDNLSGFSQLLVVFFLRKTTGKLENSSFKIVSLKI